MFLTSLIHNIITLCFNVANVYLQTPYSIIGNRYAIKCIYFQEILMECNLFSFEVHVLTEIWKEFKYFSAILISSVCWIIFFCMFEIFIPIISLFDLSWREGISATNEYNSHYSWYRGKPWIYYLHHISCCFFFLFAFYLFILFLFWISVYCKDFLPILWSHHQNSIPWKI